ncbi:MAG: M14 family zinc carboxypeptidase [Candidatus Omnitrophota bacterium]
MKSKTLVFLLFLTITLAAANGFAAANVELTWDFENGSLGGWRTAESNNIILSHAPGSGGLWYYFQLDGILNKTLTFVFEQARDDYFGGDNLPVLSYDRQNWAFIKNRIILDIPGDESKVRYSFTHSFAQNRAWIAFAPPFSNADRDRLEKEISSHPHVQIQTLCESPIKKLKIPIVFVTDPQSPAEEKKCVLLLCREDAYETASSWIARGAIEYLLSDDPAAAAIKRRTIFMIFPIFDVDGVAMGRAVHPMIHGGDGVFWTETWPETSYSFYEQRQMKRFLQDWKNQGRTIDYSLRLHSCSWNENLFRREYASESNYAEQDALFIETFEKKYLPWYRNPERILQDTRFSRFVGDLFPNALAGFGMSEYVYPPSFARNFLLYKSCDDLFIEGELIVRAIGERLGVPASDPPPYLHSAEFYELSRVQKRVFHARCLYRDLLGRPPEYVRVIVNEKPIDLEAMKGQELDYNRGVLFEGNITVDAAVNSHYFLASNSYKICRIPNEGSRPGPFILDFDKREK